MIAPALRDVDVAPDLLTERCAPRAQIFAAFAVMFGIPALCIVGGQAGVLRLAFPILSLVVGGYLLWRWKPAYVELVFWLWFISPFLGRMADFQGGWTPESAVELAPYITAGLAGIPLLASLSSLGNRRSMPYLSALAAILYGLILGLATLPIFDVLRALLNWLVPVIFALWVYQNRADYQRFRRAIERSFLFGVLLTGAYGIYQFFVLPDWDRLWMQNVQVNAFGAIEAMTIRVFSTMNDPAIYAAVTACGLLLLFDLKGKLRLISAAVGFIGLMLTISRSSWLSLAAGGIYLIVCAGRRQRIRLAIAVFACGVFLAGIAQVPAVHDLLLRRFESFSDPTQDISFSARVAGHEQAFHRLAQEPYGEGLGSTDANHKTDGDDDIIGPHDSSILELLYSLGWAGTLMYVIGIASLMFQVFRVHSADAFSVSAKAILVGFAAQLLLNSILIGVLGFMVWTFAAMTLAGADYARDMQNSEIQSRTRTASLAAA
ncbi:MAG: O-antigen ligase family protein [Terracidiphilus sp.]